MPVMTVAEFRKHKTWTLEYLAAQLGKTKGHLYAIEQSNRCSARLALNIEKLSEGLVDAASLNDEIAEARKAAA